MSISDLQGGKSVEIKTTVPSSGVCWEKKGGNVQKVIIYERATYSRRVLLVHLGCCELLEATWVSRKGNKRL